MRRGRESNTFGRICPNVNIESEWKKMKRVKGRSAEHVPDILERIGGQNLNIWTLTQNGTHGHR